MRHRGPTVKIAPCPPTL